MLRNLLFSWKDAGREEKGQPQQLKKKKKEIAQCSRSQTEILF